ncbi:helix-turn-helix domain-containing protein [Bosea sp. NPDC003192]|uniref:helix-turn-helix domain-containing protein n=1 Tax=Bosea sp. NPDC003192 TaxID=3390551 RepID=UPI003D00294C
MQKAAYTIAEVAKQSGHSSREIYRKLKAGKLTARKSGRKTLILADDFKAWLASLPAAELEAA